MEATLRELEIHERPKYSWHNGYRGFLMGIQSLI